MTSASATIVLIAAAVVAELGCEAVRLSADSWATIAVVNHDLYVFVEKGVVKAQPLSPNRYLPTETVLEHYRRIDQRAGAALSRALYDAGFKNAAFDIRTPAREGLNAWE